MEAPIRWTAPMVAVLLAGCATGVTAPPPAWVERGTHTDEEGLWVVGVADTEEADYRRAARRDAVEQIALAAGVDVATVDRRQRTTAPDEEGVSAEVATGDRELLRRGGFAEAVTLAGDAHYAHPAGGERYAVRLRLDRERLEALRERRDEARAERREREQAHLERVEPVQEPAFEELEGGRVDWYRGVVEATGVGSAATDQPEALAEQSARRAARAMAYARLQEVREGVAVARSQTVEGGEAGADRVEIASSGRVRATVVEQTVERDGEQMVARATVRDRVSGGDVPEGAVILDATGTDFRPVLHTRVEAPDGEALVDPNGSDPATPYARTVAEAVRLGADPRAQIRIERSPLPGVVAVGGLSGAQERAIERGNYVVVSE